MLRLNDAVEKALSEMILTSEQILAIAGRFCLAMREGLAGRESSLKMRPSYLDKPTGQETGTYAAIDFGGTNIRVMRVKLMGGGRYEIERASSFKVFHAEGRQIFAKMASELKKVLVPGEPIALGHVFSFPFQQNQVNQAILLHWTKEIKIPGVEGEDVTRLLKEALEIEGMGYVIPRAVLNDTVGTYLTFAYQEPAAGIASICGTGHNSCCLCLTAGQERIVNLESGNFDPLTQTHYDRLLDEQAETPGQQRLEKMVGGRYLGELFRLMSSDCLDSPWQAYEIRTEDLMGLLDPRARQSFKALKATPEDLVVLGRIARALIKRAACLTAATYLGMLHYMDPTEGRHYAVGIDGSLYQHNALFAEQLNYILRRYSRQVAGIHGVGQGSVLGAAIAAALTMR
ncbi:MAG: hypothetical protein LBT32_08660 [Peptococcaceae bacterium]|jgi:hexokinase|nr:hypothetical protein [Peptococcaceae bacterium]